MELVYIVYWSNYEDVVRDSGSDATEILGVFKNRKDAVELAKKEIQRVLGYNYYVLDDECNDIERDNIARFFGNHQENWRDYFEIVIKESEVK